MSEVQVPPDVASHDENDSELGLIDLMIVLAKHKKLICIVPLIAAVVSAGVSLALPETYKAAVKLLPPQQQQSGASALLAQFGGVASMAAGVAGLKNPNDLYVGMLKSRTIADRLIARYDLKKVYQTELAESARMRLSENTAIASGKDGLITIEVEDRDQKRVAKLANSYVDELFNLTRTLAVTEAAQRRLFFERELESAKNKLAKAEIALKSALEKHGVISVDVESRTAVETMARLRAQISAKEIELNSMRAFVTSSHPEFQRAQEELNSLRGQLSKIENGQEKQGGEESAGANVQQGGLESIQRFRDLKYFQMLYELLVKQYEAARLDEAKDPSIVQVLDPAVEPEHRAKPKRAFIVLASVIASFVAAVIAAFVLESKAKALANPASARKWAELVSRLRKA